ncbi:MAG: DMT family transporter [Chloracidobacterium sp.]|nr:DMT family transporter [Chloracidobacterium sp.]
MRVFLYTSFALVAFAFNSILCRLALRGDEADAVGFTAVRLLSGAIALVVIWYVVGRVRSPHVCKGSTGDEDALTHVRATDTGSWSSAIFLFAYAICFSFAYLGLTAGTGALILFGSVQMTMIVVTLFRGDRPPILEWLGLITAVGGLVYLVFPGLASPPLTSSLLMAAAGASWGIYTLRGRGSTDPLGQTTGNFIRTLPFAAVIAVIFLPNLHLSTRGITLAVLSGAVTSGIGYTVWYASLKHHTATRAAVLQLAVPVITAMIGVLLLAETADIRLVIAAALILGGIALTIFGKRS